MGKHHNSDMMPDVYVCGWGGGRGTLHGVTGGQIEQEMLKYDV